MAEAPRLADRQDALKKEVRAWVNLTKKKLLFRLATLGIRERAALLDNADQEDAKPLKQSLRGKVRTRFGDVEQVAFSFSRAGIWIEHGVGRGRPKGSALASRYAKPWLKPVLSEELETLADLLENAYADITSAEVRMLIPGVIDTRINGIEYPEFIQTTTPIGRSVKVAIDPSFF